MGVKLVIESPHRFPERLLLFGDAGAGKSSAVCNMARYMPDKQFWIADTDVSFAYDRMLATEYQDVDAQGNVHVLMSTDWDEYTANMDQIMAQADPKVDVLVVDNGTFPWQWVQDHHTNAQYGVDIDDYYLQLKRQYHDDTKGYMAAVAEGMSWPLVNKKFHKGFYRPFHKWAGHAVIVTQAKQVSKQEKDEDIVAQFKVHGAMPAGQKDLSYVMATNILMLDRGKIGGKQTWAISTTKDRGRDKVEKMEIDEFARDYLVDIAGWELKRVRT